MRYCRTDLHRSRAASSCPLVRTRAAASSDPAPRSRVYRLPRDAVQPGHHPGATWAGAATATGIAVQAGRMEGANVGPDEQQLQDQHASP